jgi:dihydropteroate synthase
MGVVNVTPDSFSDGGRWFDPDRAVQHGRELAAAGADLVDVGGESTRPGAVRVDLEEELRRVVPVVRALADDGVDVSVDTMRADVAEAALDAGAVLVNDVSGGRADDRMVPLAAERGVPLVLMHWRGHSDRMQDLTHYDDVVDDVVTELTERVDEALAAGGDRSRLVVDPGLGFSKTGDQNWSVLAALSSFTALGLPVLVAASRKRFLGELLADAEGTLRPPAEREAATVALTALAAQAGAWAVRVHEVAASADVVRVVARVAQERTAGGAADVR